MLTRIWHRVSTGQCYYQLIVIQNFLVYNTVNLHKLCFISCKQYKEMTDKESLSLDIKGFTGLSCMLNLTRAM